MGVFDIVMTVIAALTVIIAIIMAMYLKQRHRTLLMHQQLPGEYLKILEKHVALYSILPEPFKHELHGRITIFLDEKEFEGCGGLEITDRIKVTIAAFACILLLNKNFDYYPKLNSILVYPDAYVAPDVSASLGGVAVVQKASVRLGESWTRGDLVLSWRQIENESGNLHCHQNVILHEFAHQLDQLDGYADGTPPLADKDIYREWHNVMTREYDHLCSEAEHAVKDVIDWYGATNPAEFFAVTTESFFCNPLALKRAHEKLYGLFMEFYQLDPGTWRHQH